LHTAAQTFVIGFSRCYQTDPLVVSGQAVQAQFNKLGDTAKSLYGDSYEDTKSLINTAAEMQKNKPTDTEGGLVRRGLVRRGLAKTAKTVTTLVGGAVGSKIGAPGKGAMAGGLAGDKISDLILNFGKSGAVKIGISPTESIFLSPKQVQTRGMGRLIAKLASKPTLLIVAAVKSLAATNDTSVQHQQR
jgi:hypothetical protein